MHRHLNLAVLLVALLCCGTAAAQPPIVVPESATQEELDQVVVPLSEPVRRRIEEALRQQAQGNAPAGSDRAGGDPILEDVLDVIRRRGSVLDGSSLDSGSGELPQRTGERSDTWVPAPQRDAQFPLSASMTAEHPDARFHVAESLLRAARELASLSRRDPASENLVAAMRQQATALLLDEYSQDTNRFE